MMKLIVSSILIALLSLAACFYLPWWTIAVVAFIVSISIYLKPWVAFIGGFVAVFTLWIALSIFISNNNENILAHKMALVVLHTDSPFGLILLTGIIGGVVAGFGALTGSLLRRTVVVPPPAVIP
ncbi:MAG: hypothetical protein WKF89_10165 [Chitinophagaceae bacterium]